MSRTPASSRRTAVKDMYWFAHGGIETVPDNPQSRHINIGAGDTEDESSENNSLSWRQSNLKDGISASHSEASENSFPSWDRDKSLQSNEVRTHVNEKRLAVEERKKQLLDAEQEKNEAIMRKSSEREAALEARRNAQRSSIAFAFGSSVPRNLDPDVSPAQQNTDTKRRPVSMYGLPSRTEDNVKYILHSNNEITNEKHASSLSDGYLGQESFFTNAYTTTFSHENVSGQDNKYSLSSSWLSGSGACVAENLMTQSFTSPAVSRGRRKNDLTPTVPYDRTGLTRPATSSGCRKRSVSMSRLDQLAQPRRAYVEAKKSGSTIGNSSVRHKDPHSSPTRPVSSASEKSNGSNNKQPSVAPVMRRTHTKPTKPRPISYAGVSADVRSFGEFKSTPVKPSRTAVSKNGTLNSDASHKIIGNDKVIKKLAPKKTTVDKSKPSESLKAPKSVSSKPAVSKSNVPKTSTPKQYSPKTSSSRKILTNKKQAAILLTAPYKEDSQTEDSSKHSSMSPARSPSPDSEAQHSDEKTAKRIISEEEAKAALAEKRRLAREQAEKEAELERQRQEELRQQELDRLQLEEEERKRMEEEELKLAEEHRKSEEEKLKKAIEEQQKREEDERAKKEEEARLKAEQDKRAKEEAEKQRLELEEKLKREEEERAERKKRLEKIMSRTRGKAGVSSPSGSTSGSDQPDSLESQQNSGSGPHSLEDNPLRDSPHEQHDDVISEQNSESKSANVQTLTLPAETGSLNSNDLMIQSSENTSLDGSLQVMPSENNSLDSNQTTEPIGDIVFSPSEMSEEYAAVESSEVRDEFSTENVAAGKADLLYQNMNEQHVNVSESLQNETNIFTSSSDDKQLVDNELAVESVAEMDNYCNSDNQFPAFADICKSRESVHELDADLEQNHDLDNETGFTKQESSTALASENVAIQESAIEGKLTEQQSLQNVEDSGSVVNLTSSEYIEPVEHSLHAAKVQDEAETLENIVNKSEDNKQFDNKVVNSNEQSLLNADVVVPVIGDDQVLGEDFNISLVNVKEEKQDTLSADADVDKNRDSGDSLINESNILNTFDNNNFPHSSSVTEEGNDVEESVFSQNNIEPKMPLFSASEMSDNNLVEGKTLEHNIDTIVVDETLHAVASDSLQQLGVPDFDQFNSNTQYDNDNKSLKDELLEKNIDIFKSAMFENYEDVVHEQLDHGELFVKLSEPEDESYQRNCNEQNISDVPESFGNPFAVEVSEMNTSFGGTSEVLQHHEESRVYSSQSTDLVNLENSAKPPQDENVDTAFIEYIKPEVKEQLAFQLNYSEDISTNCVADEKSETTILPEAGDSCISDKQKDLCDTKSTYVESENYFNLDNFEEQSEIFMNKNELSALDIKLPNSENAESEDSSLDSNLSQVLNVHSVENAANIESDTVHDAVVYRNGHSPVPGENVETDHFETEGYLFNVRPLYNGESVLKSNGYDNTHMSSDRYESTHFKVDQSPVLSQDMQLQSNGIDSNNISSVDAGNMFENVDHVFSKSVSNPFCDVENLNQISSNPFLQEKQQPVTTELLN